jgi:hypothetical protein
VSYHPCNFEHTFLLGRSRLVRSAVSNGSLTRCTHEESIVPRRRRRFIHHRHDPARRALRFLDAAELVLQLSDQFAFARAAILLDAAMLIRDVTVFVDPRLHSIATALDWVASRLAHDDAVTRCLLLSIGDDDVTQAVARERDRYDRTRGLLTAIGIELVDWIHGDSDLLCSLAYATDSRAAWPSDPPRERQAVLEIMIENDRRIRDGVDLHDRSPDTCGADDEDDTRR